MTGLFESTVTFESGSISKLTLNYSKLFLIIPRGIIRIMTLVSALFLLFL